jgi:hypothetical protein
VRALATADRIRELMRRLGREASRDLTVYLTGGATAVLIGWRDSTVDVDLKIVPEDDALLRAIPLLKEQLDINVELAAPSDFIPAPEGWESRSPHIGREGRIDWRHFDLTAQALAKIERGHEHDRRDVEELLRRGLVTREALRDQFERIRPHLYRYPALDAGRFAARVAEWVRSQAPG